MNNWAFQWKISFIPDPSEQAQEVIFSHKKKNLPHPSLGFNNNNVLQAFSQKHLGVTLNEPLNNVLNKVNKTIGLLRKLQKLLSRSTLITIYKAFRSHLDYGDILYDQICNGSLHEKLESIQYNACLALKGAIRGVLQRRKYIKNFVLSPFELVVGTEIFALFIKSLVMSILDIF